MAGADERLEPRTSTVRIGAASIGVAEIVRVAEGGAQVVLDPDARSRMARSRRTLEDALACGTSVYGLTAGVGSQKTVSVSAGAQDEFNRLMILAHCVGHGDLAPARYVRAAMCVRAQGLAQGAAGSRPEIAEGLLAALNAQVVPSVHLIGSLGQSDLAPLAEIARALIGRAPMRSSWSGRVSRH